MRSESLEFITLLQKKTSHIRNICILAHVDHGKTTLADCLIASNGIISKRLAGKLRYMDSREDEQKRGITMKSSAISLIHTNNDDEHYLINLIDSPGHIDFSSEVSTAVRICDGALVIVDVVEGVCPQTNAVLRQAWLEGIKPCLVLNKMDRLITELKLSPLEAFYHLQKVLEQVNAVTGILFSQYVMENSTKSSDDVETTEVDNQQEKIFDWSSGLDDADDENLYFSPAQGNVVFASAIDGWAFGIDTFTSIYMKKLGVTRKVLSKTLWGDYYLNMKAKKIMKGAYSKGKKPLFVQCILDNIWSIYDAVTLNRDVDKIGKITTSLGLKITARDAKYADTRIHLHAIFTQWLSLSNALLNMVCKVLPSPLNIMEERVKNLMCGSLKKFESYNMDTQKLKEDLLKCSRAVEAPVIVFVSKMVSVSRDMLPHNKKRQMTKEELEEKHEAMKAKYAAKLLEEQNTTSIANVNDNKEGSDKTEVVENNHVDSVATSEEVEVSDSSMEDHFIAFARVFSGTVRKDSILYVLGPKYDPNKYNNLSTEEIEEMIKQKEVTRCESLSLSDNIINDYHMSKCKIEDLYLMMGKEFEIVEEVPVGNIFGINGLGKHILKSATISTSIACPPFTPMPLEARPIVRVAIEAKYPTQIPKLVHGMKLLNQADPCVQVLVQETGEYVIVAAGEVHLQRCLDDLKERFAKIEIKVSDPIVPFRETIVLPPKFDMLNEEIGNINKSNTHHTQRLPNFMLKEIQSFSDTIKKRVTNEDDTLIEEQFSKEEISASKKSLKLIEKLGYIEAYTANKQHCICLHAKPLPESILKILESNLDLFKVIQTISNETSIEDRNAAINILTKETKIKIKDLYNSIKNEFQSAGKIWKNVVDKIWSFGPKGVNNNILVNNIKDYNRTSIWYGLIDNETTETTEAGVYREFDNSVASGFQVTVQAGPICEEPVIGVAFFVEEWKLADEQEKDLACGPLSGQYISAIREGCRRAIMAQPMRLVAAMYSCQIQASSDVLGKLYGVLGKREGKILSEDMKEGSDIFVINAQLPVAESFGFAEDIRKKTSGLASPQLVFSHWEVLDTDPFWTPTTEEEYELYGEKADSENQALKYVNLVRKRKGLYVEEKTVEHGEKQRTLKKNK